MRSPCIKVCKVKQGECIGCGRTLEQISKWTQYTEQERKEIEDYILSKLNNSRESKQKGVEVAKPSGITLTRGKYKVTLTIENKKCHIGYYKTLEDATEALEEAKKDIGEVE